MKKFWLNLKELSAKRPLVTLFLIIFVYAFCSFLFARNILAPNMNWQSVNGNLAGDPQEYQKIAFKKYVEMKNSGLSAFELRPDLSGPSGVMSLIYLAGGDINSLLLLNAIMHACSAVLLVLILRFWFPFRTAVLASIPLFLSPYFIVWFSQINKDSYIVLGSLLIVYGFTGLTKLTVQNTENSLKFKFSYFLFCAVGIFVVGLARLYLNQIYLASIMCIFVVSILRTKIKNAIFYSVFCFCLIYQMYYFSIIVDSDITLNNYIKTSSAQSSQSQPISSTVTAVQPTAASLVVKSNQSEISAAVANCYKNMSVENWKDDFFVKYVNLKIKSLLAQRCLTFITIESQSNMATLRSTIDLDVLPSSTWEGIKYIPRASLFGVFAPWPVHWFLIFEGISSTFYAIVPIEALLLYVGIVFVLVWLFRRRQWLMLVPLFMSFSTMAIYGMSTPFIGALYRYRYVWWMLLISLGIAAMIDLYMDKKRN